jgi:protein translocase SecG subunit
MIAVHYLAWVFFFLSAVLLTIVVLLQESKGGGIAEAFGGTAAETFGVKAGGINRFTFLCAAVFCGSAIVISSTWSA